MALGKQQRKNNLKAFSLKIKLKNGDKFLEKPVFEVKQRKEDGKYELLPETHSEVSGNLIGVEAKEYVYKNNPIRSFTLTLQDKEDIYFVNVPFNTIGRNLANALLALKDFSDVSIGLYSTKPKVEGGKSYPAASLRQDGEIVRWKFEQDKLEAPDVTTFKGQTMRDFTKQEQFFMAQLNELNKVIKSKAPASVTDNSEQVTDSAPEGEDVPF
jgi:hypothetical protein